MTKQPEIYLETKIPLDEEVNAGLRGKGAYITMRELGQKELMELRSKADGKKSRAKAGRDILKYLSSFFVEGKLPDKNGKLVKVTKKMFADGVIPAVITNYVTGVVTGVIMPKKEKATSSN